MTASGGTCSEKPALRYACALGLYYGTRTSISPPCVSVFLPRTTHLALHPNVKLSSSVSRRGAGSAVPWPPVWLAGWLNLHLTRSVIRSAKCIGKAAHYPLGLKATTSVRGQIEGYCYYRP